MSLSLSVAALNIILGLVYTSYGLMTIVDLKRDWRFRGVSHFGLAWIAMAFTCGPHHLDHGLQFASVGGNAGPLDVMAVVIGMPAGVIWFLLRVEALNGGRGDRFISGTPPWLKALTWAGVLYALVLAASVAVVMRQPVHFTPRLTPNLLLLGLYFLIGFYLLRTQLANRATTGGWSVSGVALTIIFPTCGVMHAMYMVYASTGRYAVEWHCLVIDWLAVPAAIYFVWVVRNLSMGVSSDWNDGATGAKLQAAAS